MESLLYNKDKLSGRTVLLRVDFNVEVKQGRVQSRFRLERVIPTIKDLQSAGAKIIIASHIDEKEGGTLEPVAKALLPEFPKLFFVEDIFSAEARSASANMKEGDVILFENLRKWSGEKANDSAFAAHLASFADIYVNEAFSVSHRAHASIIGVPKLLPSFIGPAFKAEIEHLSKAFHPQRPFLFVIGGAKFETKLPLLHKFLAVADKVAVMGALANTFFKARGLFVGESEVAKPIPNDVREMLGNPKIILPTDVITSYKGEKFAKLPSQVGLGEKMVDAGEKTLKAIKSAVSESNFILWNGPLGKSDVGYYEGTEALAKALANSKKTAIVGGGDVVASIEKLNLMKKFTFVSSGGGAMLTFLSDETLVGLEAVKRASHRIAFSKSKNKKSFLTRLGEWF